MNELFTVADIAARYKCCKTTARNRMRKMPHMENPLMVTESALLDWENGRTYYPINVKKRSAKKWKNGKNFEDNFFEIPKRNEP
jgi:hypothetical protein